jgi:hypothetical protein
MANEITIKARNNSDARRMGERSIRIPGAVSVKHTGMKNVKVVSSDLEATKTWLDAAFEVDSYTVAE